MKTFLVIDGYNAIFGIPSLKAIAKRSLIDARRKMMSISHKYARSSGYITDVRIIFDGDNRYGNKSEIPGPRRVRHSFSLTGEGDDTIIATINKCSRIGRVVVASNDNYVRNNARGYGASLIYVQELTGNTTRKSAPQDGDIKKIGKRKANRINREYMEELGL